MSDLVSRLLAAIDEAEQDYRSKAGDERHQKWALEESPDYNEGCITAMALDGLRHCKADRKLVGEFLEVDRVMKNAAEFELTNASVSGFRNGLQRGIYGACDRYGISVEEETPG